MSVHVRRALFQYGSGEVAPYPPFLRQSQFHVVDVAGGPVDHEAFGGVALEEHGGILFEGTAGRMVCAAIL